MKTLQYQIHFTNPAFLGNAEQSGQWRTPPIKSLLRQWWRIAYAQEKRFIPDVAEMRREEGPLFGHAWPGDDRHEQGSPVAARKSRVRIRLDRWDAGKLQRDQWPRFDQVRHPEVTSPIGSDLYLGYGPLTFQRGSAPLKAHAAIQSGESATLSLAMPESDAPLIEQALSLMDQFGTLGGRSRNGWGSFSLTPLPPAAGWEEAEPPLRSWEDCLKLDWPHAIGQDRSGPLIWQTGPMPDWKAVMQRLAEIKIGLRTRFAFSTGNQTAKPEARHWLSYPVVTRHRVRSWEQKNLRLPNTLRFKVRPTGDGRLSGVIFHVPHLPPNDFSPDKNAIKDVWRQVHQHLDATQNLTRYSGPGAHHD